MCGSVECAGKLSETDPDILTKLCLRSKIGRVQAYTQQIQGDKYRVFGTGFAVSAGMDSCSATQKDGEQQHMGGILVGTVQCLFIDQHLSKSMLPFVYASE